MNREVIISCAITGAGDTASRHPDLPITPKQIATAAIEAAKAGAALPIAMSEILKPVTARAIPNSTERLWTAFVRPRPTSSLT